MPLPQTLRFRSYLTTVSELTDSRNETENEVHHVDSKLSVENRKAPPQSRVDFDDNSTQCISTLTPVTLWQKHQSVKVKQKDISEPSQTSHSDKGLIGGLHDHMISSIHEAFDESVMTEPSQNYNHDRDLLENVHNHTISSSTSFPSFPKQHSDVKKKQENMSESRILQVSNRRKKKDESVHDSDFLKEAIDVVIEARDSISSSTLFPTLWKIAKAKKRTTLDLTEDDLPLENINPNVTAKTLTSEQKFKSMHESKLLANSTDISSYSTKLDKQTHNDERVYDETDVINNVPENKIVFEKASVLSTVSSRRKKFTAINSNTKVSEQKDVSSKVERISEDNDLVEQTKNEVSSEEGVDLMFASSDVVSSITSLSSLQNHPHFVVRGGQMKKSGSNIVSDRAKKLIEETQKNRPVSKAKDMLEKSKEDKKRFSESKIFDISSHNMNTNTAEKTNEEPAYEAIDVVLENTENSKNSVDKSFLQSTVSSHKIGIHMTTDRNSLHTDFIDDSMKNEINRKRDFSNKKLKGHDEFLKSVSDSVSKSIIKAGGNDLDADVATLVIMKAFRESIAMGLDIETTIINVATETARGMLKIGSGRAIAKAVSLAILEMREKLMVSEGVSTHSETKQEAMSANANGDQKNKIKVEKVKKSDGDDNHAKKKLLFSAGDELAKSFTKNSKEASTDHYSSQNFDSYIDETNQTEDYLMGISKVVDEKTRLIEKVKQLKEEMKKIMKDPQTSKEEKHRLSRTMKGIKVQLKRSIQEVETEKSKLCKKLTNVAVNNNNLAEIRQSESGDNSSQSTSEQTSSPVHGIDRKEFIGKSIGKFAEQSEPTRPKSISESIDRYTEQSEPTITTTICDGTSENEHFVEIQLDTSSQSERKECSDVNGTKPDDRNGENLLNTEQTRECKKTNRNKKDKNSVINKTHDLLKECKTKEKKLLKKIAEAEAEKRKLIEDTKQLKAEMKKSVHKSVAAETEKLMLSKLMEEFQADVEKANQGAKEVEADHKSKEKELLQRTATAEAEKDHAIEKMLQIQQQETLRKNIDMNEYKKREMILMKRISAAEDEKIRLIEKTSQLRKKMKQIMQDAAVAETEKLMLSETMQEIKVHLEKSKRDAKEAEVDRKVKEEELLIRTAVAEAEKERAIEKMSQMKKEEANRKNEQLAMQEIMATEMEEERNKLYNKVKRIKAILEQSKLDAAERAKKEKYLVERVTESEEEKRRLVDEIERVNDMEKQYQIREEFLASKLKKAETEKTLLMQQVKYIQDLMEKSESVDRRGWLLLLRKIGIIEAQKKDLIEKMKMIENFRTKRGCYAQELNKKLSDVKSKNMMLVRRIEELLQQKSYFQKKADDSNKCLITYEDRLNENISQLQNQGMEINTKSDFDSSIRSSTDGISQETYSAVDSFSDMESESFDRYIKDDYDSFSDTSPTRGGESIESHDLVQFDKESTEISPEVEDESEGRESRRVTWDAQLEENIEVMAYSGESIDSGSSRETNQSYIEKMKWNLGNVKEIVGGEGIYGEKKQGVTIITEAVSSESSGETDIEEKQLNRRRYVHFRNPDCRSFSKYEGPRDSILGFSKRDQDFIILDGTVDGDESESTEFGFSENSIETALEKTQPRKRHNVSLSGDAGSNVSGRKGKKKSLKSYDTDNNFIILKAATGGFESESTEFVSSENSIETSLENTQLRKRHNGSFSESDSCSDSCHLGSVTALSSLPKTNFERIHPMQSMERREEGINKGKGSPEKKSCINDNENKHPLRKSLTKTIFERIHPMQSKKRREKGFNESDLSISEKSGTGDDIDKGLPGSPEEVISKDATDKSASTFTESQSRRSKMKSQENSYDEFDEFVSDSESELKLDGLIKILEKEVKDNKKRRRKAKTSGNSPKEVILKDVGDESLSTFTESQSRRSKMKSSKASEETSFGKASSEETQYGEYDEFISDSDSKAFKLDKLVKLLEEEVKGNKKKKRKVKTPGNSPKEVILKNVGDESVSTFTESQSRRSKMKPPKASKEFFFGRTSSEDTQYDKFIPDSDSKVFKLDKLVKLLEEEVSGNKKRRPKTRTSGRTPKRKNDTSKKNVNENSSPLFRFLKGSKDRMKESSIEKRQHERFSSEVPLETVTTIQPKRSHRSNKSDSYIYLKKSDSEEMHSMLCKANSDSIVECEVDKRESESIIPASMPFFTKLPKKLRDSFNQLSSSTSIKTAPEKMQSHLKSIVLAPKVLSKVFKNRKKEHSEKIGKIFSSSISDVTIDKFFGLSSKTSERGAVNTKIVDNRANDQAKIIGGISLKDAESVSTKSSFHGEFDKYHPSSKQFNDDEEMSKTRELMENQNEPLTKVPTKNDLGYCYSLDNAGTKVGCAIISNGTENSDDRSSEDANYRSTSSHDDSLVKSSNLSIFYPISSGSCTEHSSITGCGFCKSKTSSSTFYDSGNESGLISDSDINAEFSLFDGVSSEEGRDSETLMSMEKVSTKKEVNKSGGSVCRIALVDNESEDIELTLTSSPDEFNSCDDSCDSEELRQESREESDEADSDMSSKGGLEKENISESEETLRLSSMLKMLRFHIDSNLIDKQKNEFSSQKVVNQTAYGDIQSKAKPSSKVMSACKFLGRTFKGKGKKYQQGIWNELFDG